MDNKESAKSLLWVAAFGGLFTALDLGSAHEVTLISDPITFYSRNALCSI